MNDDRTDACFDTLGVSLCVINQYYCYFSGETYLHVSLGDIIRFYMVLKGNHLYWNNEVRICETDMYVDHINHNIHELCFTTMKYQGNESNIFNTVAWLSIL